MICVKNCIKEPDSRIFIGDICLSSCVEQPSRCVAPTLRGNSFRKMRKKHEEESNEFCYHFPWEQAQAAVEHVIFCQGKKI